MRASRLSCCLLACALAAGSLSASADEALLIGGGYNLQGSQGQIELNVKWVQGILEDQGLPVITWFTDGDETGPDVHFHVMPGSEASLMEPLARVFGQWVLENRRYREHTVANVRGSTRREDLEPQLRDVVAGSPGEDLLLIYNGHGGQSYSTPDKVTLNLWDDTRLSANELHALLEPRQGAFRFVFTQCYSGGFHRLAYADSARGLALSDTPRCGFTAESAYRMAEGCSASIETDDYRDYTTFFFAALSGRERDGEIISRDPDRNRDGQTTLREAHLFTLEEAYSADLSRSTSEDYLDQWQPWYLRWLPAEAGLADNEYATLFRKLAVRHNIALDGDTRVSLRQALAAAKAQWQALAEERLGLEQQINKLQHQLQHVLLKIWPQLMGPYTGAYHKLAGSKQLLAIAKQIQALPDYRKLVELQNRNTSLDMQLLDKERLVTQHQKLIWLRRLALLRQQLEDYGSEREQTDYQSLLSCEETPLTR